MACGPVSNHSAAAVSVLAAPSREAASLGWRSVAPTLHFLVRSRIAFWLGLIYLTFAAVLTLVGHFPELQGIMPQALFEAFQPQRQGQSGALSFPASRDPDRPGGAVGTARRSGIAGSHLAAAGQMRASNRSKCFVSEFIFPSLHRWFWNGFPAGLLPNFLWVPAASRS